MLEAQLTLAGLETLMKNSTGRAEVPIGLIDGPVDASHPDLGAATIRQVPSKAPAACTAEGSPACIHGTFVAGILAARRGSRAAAIAPDSPLFVRPIFCEAGDLAQCPTVTPSSLASALEETIASGARVINLSLGLADSSLTTHPDLERSFDHAFRKGVLVVAASGNYGSIGSIPLFSHPWVIPVAACDPQGRIRARSNMGASLGKRGLMAPGEDVESVAPGGKYTTMSGTSVAAPFVTGAIALLWSIYPGASAERVRTAILRPGEKRSSIVPPLLNGEASRKALAAEFPNRMEQNA